MNSAFISFYCFIALVIPTIQSFLSDLYFPSLLRVSYLSGTCVQALEEGIIKKTLNPRVSLVCLVVRFL